MKKSTKKTVSRVPAVLASVALAFLSLFAAGGCSHSVNTPDDIGAIRGYVIIGSLPEADVQVTLDGTITRSTNSDGEYRFVNLTVGDTHTVSTARFWKGARFREAVTMHVSEQNVTVPDTHVAYANFFGDQIKCDDAERPETSAGAPYIEISGLDGTTVGNRDVWCVAVRNPRSLEWRFRMSNTSPSWVAVTADGVGLSAPPPGTLSKSYGARVLASATGVPDLHLDFAAFVRPTPPRQ